MKILLVAATVQEIEPMLKDLGFCEGINEYQGHLVYVLITGVGMTATAFALGRQLVSEQYDIVFNIGIAGSFDRNLALGEVVQITHDRFSELGTQNGNDFIAIDELGFGKQETICTPPAIQPAVLLRLKKVTAITVNTAHGNKKSISAITERFNPQTESMEGAAFFYACNQMNVPCIQIRAISNYVERRNRDRWNIGLAIKNLNTFAVNLISMLVATQQTDNK